MTAITTFDARVAARTRAAAQILSTKELLALYESHGGLKEDLELIQKHGQKAEALSHARSGNKSVGESATLSVLTAFADLQKEYAAVMAVVQAVRFDIQTAGGKPDVVSALEHILKNEAPVVYRSEPSADGDAKPKKRAVTSSSQEALRAEIHKDAVALLALTAASAALKKRGVTAARLEALRDAAKALSSQLSDRTTKKGAGKAATDSLKAAVAAQKEVWSACYRIFYAAAQQDARIHKLLKDTIGKK